MTAPGVMARNVGHAVGGDGEGNVATLGVAPVAVGVGVVAFCCGDAHESVTERMRRSARVLSTPGNTAPRVQLCAPGGYLLM